jgi:hypothetical protein
VRQGAPAPPAPPNRSARISLPDLLFACVAAERGAVALIVANDADTLITLGSTTDVKIPVIIVTKFAGARATGAPWGHHLAFNAGVKTQPIRNVIAQTKTGSGFWGAGEHELFGSNKLGDRRYLFWTVLIVLVCTIFRDMCAVVLSGPEIASGVWRT